MKYFLKESSTVVSLWNEQLKDISLQFWRIFSIIKHHRELNDALTADSFRANERYIITPEHTEIDTEAAHGPYLTVRSSLEESCPGEAAGAAGDERDVHRPAVDQQLWAPALKNHNTSIWSKQREPRTLHWSLHRINAALWVFRGQYQTENIKYSETLV